VAYWEKKENYVQLPSIREKGGRRTTKSSRDKRKETQKMTLLKGDESAISAWKVGGKYTLTDSKGESGVGDP